MRLFAARDKGTKKLYLRWEREPGGGWDWVDGSATLTPAHLLTPQERDEILALPPRRLFTFDWVEFSLSEVRVILPHFNPDDTTKEQ